MTDLALDETTLDVLAQKIATQLAQPKLEYWSVEDIAKVTGYGLTTVRGWSKRPGFPVAIMTNGTRRWKPDEFRLWFERQRSR